LIGDFLVVGLQPIAPIKARRNESVNATQPMLYM
jgi:hypothetical protein